MPVRLRPLEAADLDLVFEWERDPEAVRLAAFTRVDPSNRSAFDAHRRAVTADPANVVLGVELDGHLVGTVGSFTVDSHREITYWIDPARWGEGIGSAAVAALLAVETSRPLVARVAEHNVGSTKVLERAGFVHVGSDTGYANGVGRTITEHIYRLPA